MLRHLAKSWAIGAGITLLLFLLVRLGGDTPFGFGIFFFFPFALLAESWAYLIAGGSRFETPLFVCLALGLGGIFYGVPALIVLRFRARKLREKATAAGVQ